MVKYRYMETKITNDGLILNGSGGRILTEEDIKSFSQDDFFELLISIIPSLKNINNTKKGSEGKVYFVDKNFVVKKYGPSYMEYFTKKKLQELSPFEDYFYQMQDFWEKGLSVNKFYSYAIIPKGENSGLYVLQERVKGKNLFEERCLEQMFGKLPFECSKEEFNRALISKDGEIYYAIIDAFLKSVYDTNLTLLGMPDEVVSNFVLSDLDIRNEGRYAFPDVQASNIIMSDKNLTHIDMALLYGKLGRRNKDEVEDNKVMVMRDVTDIFRENLYAYLLISITAGLDPVKAKINDFEQENKRVTAKALSKYIDITNDLIAPMFKKKNTSDFEALSGNVSPVVNKEDKKLILDKIEREF